MKPIRLIASLFTVGAWTLLSRILGFARDILITAFLGAGPVAEAFLIAFAAKYVPPLFCRGRLQYGICADVLEKA